MIERAKDLDSDGPVREETRGSRRQEEEKGVLLRRKSCCWAHASVFLSYRYCCALHVLSLALAVGV